MTGVYRAPSLLYYQRPRRLIQFPSVTWGNVENTDFGFSYYLSQSWTASVATLNPVANNALVVVLATRSARTDIVAPSGWDLVASEDTASPAFYIYEKLATGNEGGEADPIWTFSDSVARGFIWSAKFKGNYSASGIYDQSDYVAGGAIDTSPSVTPTDQPGLVFSMLYERFLPTAPSAPTNMTLVKQFEEVSVSDEFSLAFKTYDSTDPTGVFAWGAVTETSVLTFNVFAAGAGELAQVIPFVPALPQRNVRHSGRYV